MYTESFTACSLLTGSDLCLCYQISATASVGNGYQGDIALDDFKLYAQSCANGNAHDFLFFYQVCVCVCVCVCFLFLDNFFIPQDFEFDTSFLKS